MVRDGLVGEGWQGGHSGRADRFEREVGGYVGGENRGVIDRGECCRKSELLEHN